MRGLHAIRLPFALIACAGATFIATAPAAAQSSFAAYAETPAAALARCVRALASDPKDFSSLIGAGRAALALGDAQAAAGFFARADEVNARSPLPQAGMGAVSVANGEAAASLPYFTRAQQLGAPVATFGTDRGLAFDLLGRQADAQADYRAALGSVDANEARRRLALSLAISGKQSEALQALAPLVAKGDAPAKRTRAFVLALTGDSAGAMTAIDAAMPGSWARVSPFLQRLPTLQAGQKAAAVNLGIFPDQGDSALAYAAPASTPASASADRLAGIDTWLRPTSPAAPAAPQTPSWQTQPVQVAYAAPVSRAPAPVAKEAPHKIWLQLASGTDSNALPSQFRRIKSKNRELFAGITGYVAKSPDRARLVIGPFRGKSDAQIFAEDLESIGVDAFSWSNSETDKIVPLGTE